MSEPRMIKRQSMVADLSVTDLVDWCVQRGFDPDAVTITATHLKYESPETDSERARREGFETTNRERHEAWERATLDRLKEKYES